LSRSPAVEVVQPLGNDTIATPLATGAEKARDVTATTKISGLQVPNVIDGHWALTECRATGGSGHAVPDELVWDTQRRLALEEGVFTEPAGAAALAGALQAAQAGKLRPDAHIACLVTGTGFKDEASITRMLGNVTAPMLDITDLASMD
jgi:threonine synthase